MTTFTTIGKHLERNAEMRREKAVEFRDEPRHNEAAKILDSLAAQFAAGDVDRELWGKLIELDDPANDLEDDIGYVIGSIGFDVWPQTPDQFLAAVIELAQENLL